MRNQKRMTFFDWKFWDKLVELPKHNLFEEKVWGKMSFGEFPFLKVDEISSEFRPSHKFQLLMERLNFRHCLP